MKLVTSIVIYTSVGFDHKRGVMGSHLDKFGRADAPQVTLRGFTTV